MSKKCIILETPDSGGWFTVSQKLTHSMLYDYYKFWICPKSEWVFEEENFKALRKNGSIDYEIQECKNKKECSCNAPHIICPAKTSITLKIGDSTSK